MDIDIPNCPICSREMVGGIGQFFGSWVCHHCLIGAAKERTRTNYRSGLQVQETYEHGQKRNVVQK